MIKLSASTAAWQLIWQVNTWVGKQKTFFFFPLKKEGEKFQILNKSWFWNTEMTPIDFSGTSTHAVLG